MHSAVKDVRRESRNSDGNSLPSVPVPNGTEEQDIISLGYLRDAQNSEVEGSRIQVSFHLSAFNIC
jgi:hypothetical protein